MLFSERNGYLQHKQVQHRRIDEDLRNSLWSIFYLYFVDRKNTTIDSLSCQILMRTIWFYFFKKPIDEFEQNAPRLNEQIKNGFDKWEWFRVFDFLEFVAKTHSEPSVVNEYCSACNSQLEREVSAYRFVDRCIVPVIDGIEIQEIEDAANVDDRYNAVRNHIQAALLLVSDRQNPNYRNSIKESISAVEALCKIILGDPKATLGGALDAFEKSGRIKLHGSLKKGFQCLYGYTSDADGIRHALLEEETLTFDDAKYMLVTCSAFVNYLIAKANS